MTEEAVNSASRGVLEATLGADRGGSKIDGAGL